ncbi:MAG: shikimate dehydrogenase [Candidatus Izimaplasma sp.]|nr:shikimate dehydrogenase [Candidatus Izimaplasma bacterium]
MYGLIGKDISHSFSKKIHSHFGNSHYELFNIENLKNFINNNYLLGYNVTMPYKTEIIPLIDELDEISSATNSVNTVIKKKNKLYGYNTDYYGFSKLLEFNDIQVKNKKILILGNGSVAKTVAYYLKNNHTHIYTNLARKIKTKNDDLLNNYENYNDYEIIINTTPVGMYPHNEDELLIDIKKFKNLEVVIDLIYNPLNTKLLLEAKKNNIKAINGLLMLVMQAKKAHEIFFNQEVSLDSTEEIYLDLLHELYNIVLIGLPLSGKTKYAKILNKETDKQLYDCDDEIENLTKMKIPEYFKQYSEEIFRQVETKIIRDIYKKNNYIISTGGGVIKNKLNMELLNQNGIIVFLNKDPQLISQKNITGRPLIKNSKDILKLAKERLPLYKKHSNIIVDITNDTEYHIKELKEKIDEYISNQWSEH